MRRVRILTELSLCVAHLFMTRTVGWRRGYTFSIFAFTLVTDRFSIIGGSSMRLLWLAAIIIAMAALIRKRWATAGACLSVSAMLNVFPLLLGVGALLLGGRRDLLLLRGDRGGERSSRVGGYGDGGAPERERRYESAAAFARDLDRVLTDRPIEAARCDVLRALRALTPAGLDRT